MFWVASWTNRLQTSSSTRSAKYRLLTSNGFNVHFGSGFKCTEWRTVQLRQIALYSDYPKIGKKGFIERIQNNSQSMNFV